MILIVLTVVALLAPFQFHASQSFDFAKDVDGDGVVGPTDYFVAKTFAKESGRAQKW